MSQVPQWDVANTPVGAHALAQHHLDEDGYARTRGVAQQAARLARNGRLDRQKRALLLSAAWLCDIERPTLGTARHLATAGHHRLAGIVAHHRFAAMESALAGGVSVQSEFPIPEGNDEQILMMLDVAALTTDARGVPCTPAQVVREMVAEHGPGAPSVRAIVALIARIGETPLARTMVESVAPARV